MTNIRLRRRSEGNPDEKQGISASVRKPTCTGRCVTGPERTNAIDSLKEIPMKNLGKGVMTALVISALVAGLFSCQKKEGPAEHAGKQIDKAIEKAGQQIEKAGKKIEDTAKGADKK
jgi:hypothetical protein